MGHNMNNKQEFQTVLSHLLYCLNNYQGSSWCKAVNSDSLIDDLEFFGHDASVDYVKGFVRAMARNFYYVREDDERLDKAFDAVLDF